MSEELRNGKYEDEYGEVYWYKDGERHREDGPAIEGLNGYREWWVAGQRHREDGPAFDSSCVKEWWLNGQRHREGGPAIEQADGTKQWFKKGQLHRDDGPAIEYSDGRKYWWMNGKKYTEEEFNHWLSKKQLNERLTEQLEVKPTAKKVKI